MQDYEVVVHEIDPTDGSVLVVVAMYLLYRPPNRDIVYMDKLCQLLEIIYTKINIKTLLSRL